MKSSRKRQLFKGRVYGSLVLEEFIVSRVDTVAPIVSEEIPNESSSELGQVRSSRLLVR